MSDIEGALAKMQKDCDEGYGLTQVECEALIACARALQEIAQLYDKEDWEQLAPLDIAEPALAQLAKCK